MTHSAPVLKLGRLPSLKEREQDAEEHGGTVLVSRQYLEGFLASLPQGPYPGPGDSTAASGEPDDELHVHVQDLKLAGSRMPGHRFARDRLVKVLLKQCRASGLSNLLDVGMDTTGFYAALHVDHALERKAEEEQRRWRRPGSPTEDEMASARHLLVDTLTGRVQAATIIQRAYRSYVKRKQLSKWFHSHRHQSFQRSLLSDRLWNSMARRAKTTSLYEIEERSGSGVILLPMLRHEEEEEEEEEEEDEEQPARESHPIPSETAGRRLKQVRRAFGSTFEAEWTPQPRKFLSHRPQRRLWEPEATSSVGTPSPATSEYSYGGHASGADPYTPPRVGAGSASGSAAASGQATPERLESFAEREPEQAPRWEATSASFLPPIQSGSALARLHKIRGSEGSGVRQTHSMSGVEGSLSDHRLRPISGVDAPYRASTGLIQDEGSALPGEGPAGPAGPTPERSYQRRGAISARARFNSTLPSAFPPTFLCSSDSAASAATSGNATGAEDGKDGSPVGSPSGFISGRGSPQGATSPCKPRSLEPVVHRASVQGKAPTPPESGEPAFTRRSSSNLHEPPQTSGTAIVMHGTITSRKPSRMGGHVGLGEGGHSVLAHGHKSCSSIGLARAPHAPKGAPDLNPKTLFLRWKEEERRRLEQRREMGQEVGEDEAPTETFVSFMQRAMAGGRA